MPVSFFIQPLLSGLSLGAFCLSTCFPFLASFIASENRTAPHNLSLILQFILGRFLGYIAFGLFFGALGEHIQGSHITLLTDASLILISFFMLFYLTGLLKQKESPCLANKTRNGSVITLGFLMGINVCPPFLLSLTYVFSLHNTWQGMLYFLVFFLASSIYFLPMIFVGTLARIQELRTVARWSGAISACLFILYGSYSIVNHIKAGF